MQTVTFIQWWLLWFLSAIFLSCVGLVLLWANLGIKVAQ
jgi:hypothetical protein